MQGMGISDPVDPRVLFLLVLKYVSAKSEHMWRKVPTKGQDDHDSQQTLKYHQFVVEISQVFSVVSSFQGC